MKIGIFFLFISLFLMAAVVHGMVALQSGIITGDEVDLRAEPGPYGHIISTLQRGSQIPLTVSKKRMNN